MFSEPIVSIIWNFSDNFVFDEILNLELLNYNKYYEFQLPDLTYNHDAFEPHWFKNNANSPGQAHYAGYTSKLNVAIEGTELANKSIEEILTTLDMSNSAVRNNGGGYYNHYSEIMSPNSGGEPTGFLSDAIKKSFGSWWIKSKFSAAAGTRFGSDGVHVLVLMVRSICSTANQDNPHARDVRGTPILGIDVAYAYYLNYQNRTRLC